jgi:toxin ParE1/3/4
VRVEFAPRARLDLIEIGDYLETVAGKRTASRWVLRLEAAARGIADQPHAHPENADLGGRRRVIVRPYVVVYRIASAELVRIVRILHGARDLPAIFQSDEGN